MLSLSPESSDPVEEVVVLLDDGTRVTTDEDGRCRFTALVEGYHGLRVFNPVLDSLGLSAEPVFFEVSRGEVTPARLRFRSLDTVMTELCATADASSYEGILTGFALMRRATLCPAPESRWHGRRSKNGPGGSECVYKVLTTSELPGDGSFLMCGLPRDRSVDITVERNGRESRPERFQLSQTQRVSRRDITIRGGR